jgi:flagellar M-ring protein FliF
MALVAAGILAFFIFLTTRLATPEMALLYSELDGQDSTQIVARLEQRNLPYRVSADGSQVYVASGEVGSLRLALAQDGLPSGGSVGYEIFDRSEGLGTTNFVQNINHLRALEGELARTIRSIGQVKAVRVHLVLPRRELFSRTQQQPSASIVLTMSGGRRLDGGQIQAIQQLTAAAVPGLQPNMVSIVDNHGALLARGVDEDDLQGTAGTAEEMRIGYESRLARTIEDLIERSVGRGNVRAEVSTEMDFDRITENAEIYDPDGQVVRSSQTVEETADASDGETPPPVTVGNNLPDAGLPQLGDTATSRSQTSRVEETVNYEITRTVKTHVRESGLVRRLSVAVLVNGTLSEGPDGEAAYAPRSEEEMAQFAALVRSAVGFDEERGDTLEVANLRFAELEAGDPAAHDESIFGFTYAELMRIAEILVLGIVGVLVLLLVVRPLIKQLIESQAAAAAEGGTGGGLLPGPNTAHPALAGPPGSTLPAIPGPQGTAVPASVEETVASEMDKMIDLNKVEGRVRSSSINKIGEIVEKHPDEAVAIVRHWLYQEE